MGLTLKPEASNGVSEMVVLPPRLGRNEACHCGSGAKYTRCCRERDEILRRELRGAALPESIEGSRSKLRQFEKYVCNVYWAARSVGQPNGQAAASENSPLRRGQQLVSHRGTTHPGINALEGDLKKEDFQRLIGRQPHAGGESLQRRGGIERSGQTRTVRSGNFQIDRPLRSPIPTRARRGTPGLGRPSAHYGRNVSCYTSAARA
jgi:hypothetical protein